MATIKGLTFKGKVGKKVTLQPVAVVAEDGGWDDQDRLRAAILWAHENVPATFATLYQQYGTQGLASALQYTMLAAYADDVPMSKLVELCKVVAGVK